MSDHNNPTEKTNIVHNPIPLYPVSPTKQNKKVTVPNQNIEVIQFLSPEKKIQVNSISKLYQYYTPQRPKIQYPSITNTQPKQKLQNEENTCNCKKSHCLKFYCVCFADGKMCSKNCLCEACLNKTDNPERAEAINEIIEKDQYAFSKRSNVAEFTKKVEIGCNCRRSGCTKKYCECFRKGIQCSRYCNCSLCLNSQPNRGPEKKLTQEDTMLMTLNALKKKMKLQPK